MEIQFIYKNFTEKDPKSLMDHIQSMASGEAPFFAKTLGLVYDGLVAKAFSKYIPLDSGLGSRGAATPTPPLQAPTPTPGITSSSNLRAPTPDPDPDPDPRDCGTDAVWAATLDCTRCYGITSVQDLRGGLYCPLCPETGRNGRGGIGWPFMRCMNCYKLRKSRVDNCSRAACSRAFT